MEVRIKNEYSLATTTYSNEIYEHGFEDVLKEYIDWLQDDTFESEDDLRESLEDYIRDYEDLVPNTSGDQEILDHCTYFQITNWEEIFPIIAGRVVPPKEITCCDKAPRYANFCPTCGTKLK